MAIDESKHNDHSKSIRAELARPEWLTVSTLSYLFHKAISLLGERNQRPGPITRECTHTTAPMKVPYKSGPCSRTRAFVIAIVLHILPTIYKTSCYCPCPSSPPLCSGSSLINVSILITAIHASTALFSCLTLLILGSSTPPLI